MRQLYIPDYVLSSDIPVIKENFEKLKLGKVRDICLEPHRECEYNVDNDLYSAAYLYMDYWYNTQEAEEFKNLIKTNKEAKMESDYKSWVFEFVEDDIFGFQIPKELPGLSKEICNPKLAWNDSVKFTNDSILLADMFKKNYNKYRGKGVKDYTEYGPK